MDSAVPRNNRIAAHHPNLDVAAPSFWLFPFPEMLCPPIAGGGLRPGKLTRPGSSGPDVSLSPFWDIVIFQGVFPAVNKARQLN
jgi:hypothetical protein